MALLGSGSARTEVRSFLHSERRGIQIHDQWTAALHRRGYQSTEEAINEPGTQDNCGGRPRGRCPFEACVCFLGMANHANSVLSVATGMGRPGKYFLCQPANADGLSLPRIRL